MAVPSTLDNLLALAMRAMEFSPAQPKNRFAALVFTDELFDG
jgi:hypothetical protein